MGVRKEREHVLSSVKVSDSQGQVRADCHGGDRSWKEARGGRRRHEGSVVWKEKRRKEEGNLGNGKGRPENEDGRKEDILTMCRRVHYV